MAGTAMSSSSLRERQPKRPLLPSLTANPPVDGRLLCAKYARCFYSYFTSLLIFALLFLAGLGVRHLTTWDQHFRLVGPFIISRTSGNRSGVDMPRPERTQVIRPPRLAVVTGSITNDPIWPMTFTLVRSLLDLEYHFEVFTLENKKEDQILWELVGCKVSTLVSENSHSVNWSKYEGVILITLEAKRVMSSLLVEPFKSVPVMWLIHEDTLGKRLSSYSDSGWQDHIDDWRNAFKRADVVVFPDFFLPILYSSLDTGNYFVIPGYPVDIRDYPVDIWERVSYIPPRSRNQLRAEYGFAEDDLIVLVFGSSFFYDELPWDYEAEAVMHALSFWIKKEAANASDLFGIPTFVFLSEDPGDDYDYSIQTIAADIGLPDGSLRHYILDHDVNKFLLMADIALYGSFREEQSFPPIVFQAMSFGIPVAAPDLTVIRKHIVDGKHGFIFTPRDSESLDAVFSLLIENNKPTLLAQHIASQGRRLSRTMLPAVCVANYARLLEKILKFPSYIAIPYSSASQIQQITLLRDSFDNKLRMISSKKSEGRSCKSGSEKCLSIVDLMEKRFLQKREGEEIDERRVKTSGTNQHDNEESGMTGKPYCIYEIYSGEGAWPYLHHGSIYRRIAHSETGVDDIDAANGLPLYKKEYYKDILCEFDALFAVANRIDTIHNFPWIGFQSWRTAGEEVSLSGDAAKALEANIIGNNEGAVIYFWAVKETEKHADARKYSQFWHLCDLSSAADCSSIFEDAFRLMYGIPRGQEALPPMPSDGDNWSILHSWMMPTSSFLEFVRFARMFMNSLESQDMNGFIYAYGHFGTSVLEKLQSQCSVLELLVNVWGYHSGRRMMYINPVSGDLKEQHPLELRQMWGKYFDDTLLKRMQEADEQE